MSAPPTPQGRDEILLTAAIVGAEVTREQTPHLPITPDEIAAEAKRCRDAGASVLHLHVREPDGRPTQSRDRFRDAIEAIRAVTDIIIQTSTGGAVGMSIDERVQPLDCEPEMASLNCGTINFGDEIFENSLPQMRAIAARIQKAGVVPELELYELGHLDNALILVNEGLLTAPLHVQFVLGVRGALGARPEVLRFLVSQLPADGTWGVAATGRHQLPMAELATELGGNVRVGLEDNLYLEKGVLAEGSAPLVARAALIARARGREPVTPTRAREILGIRAVG
jgi:3-keto-5-aminohexanoate cleavage enzyme